MHLQNLYACHLIADLKLRSVLSVNAITRHRIFESLFNIEQDMSNGRTDWLQAYSLYDSLGGPHGKSLTQLVSLS